MIIKARVDHKFMILNGHADNQMITLYDLVIGLKRFKATNAAAHSIIIMHD